MPALAAWTVDILPRACLAKSHGKAATAFDCDDVVEASLKAAGRQDSARVDIRVVSASLRSRAWRARPVTAAPVPRRDKSGGAGRGDEGPGGGAVCAAAHSVEHSTVTEFQPGAVEFHCAVRVPAPERAHHGRGDGRGQGRRVVGTGRTCRSPRPCLWLTLATGVASGGIAKIRAPAPMLTFTLHFVRPWLPRVRSAGRHSFQHLPWKIP